LGLYAIGLTQKLLIYIVASFSSGDRHLLLILTLAVVQNLLVELDYEISLIGRSLTIFPFCFYNPDTASIPDLNQLCL